MNFPVPQPRSTMSLPSLEPLSTRLIHPPRRISASIALSAWAGYPGLFRAKPEDGEPPKKLFSWIPSQEERRGRSSNARLQRSFVLLVAGKRR